MNTKVYKCCVVPQCKNTSSKTPDKLFVYVSHNKTKRNKWLKLARRDSKTMLSTHLYFCEDHFDLPNDMANYMEYHLMGSVSQILMKPGCMPSKFQCQPDRRKRTSDATERSYILKKQRKTLIEECQKDLEELSTKHSEQSMTKQVELEEMSCGGTIPADEIKEEIERDDVKDMNQPEYEHETTSIHEEEIKDVIIPEEEIKEEITIDEDDIFIPCMQSLLKTEKDPLETEDQISHVIEHHHCYEPPIQTLPFTSPIVSSAQESPQPIIIIGQLASTQQSTQTSVEDSSLNDQILTNMAMELQQQKTLNAINQKTIEKLRQNVKKLNSQLRKQKLLVKKLVSDTNYEI